MACAYCLRWVLCCGSIPSWMQAGLSIRAIKSHLLTSKGTEINSTEVLFNEYETLEGELLKSTWTGVKLFLPLSSFNPSFPAKSGSFTLRKKQLCFVSHRLELWADASCYLPGKYRSQRPPFSQGPLPGGLSCLQAKPNYRKVTVAALCGKTTSLTVLLNL